MPPEEIGIYSGTQSIPLETILYQQVKGADYKVPVLQLGNIHVMGDPLNHNVRQMKAYTKIEI